MPSTSSMPTIPGPIIKVAVAVGLPLLVVVAYMILGVIVTAAVGGPVLASVVVSAVVIVTAAVIRRRAPAAVSIGPPPSPIPSRRGFALLVITEVVLAFFVGQIAAMLLYDGVGSPGYDQQSQRVLTEGAALVAIWTLVSAPVAEEMLFRGLLYPVLRSRLSIIASVAATSITFAVLHANLVQLAVSLPLAVLLAIVYERTRRLTICIGLHLTFNLAAGLTPVAAISAVASPWVLVPLLLGLTVAVIGIAGRGSARGAPVAAAEGSRGAGQPRIDGHGGDRAAGHRGSG